MKISFVELSEHLREGGLEQAAADMAQYLREAGVEVLRGDSSTSDLSGVDLVHFHGLWSPKHYQVARVCWKRGIPTIVSPHGMLEPWAWKHRRWKKWPYFNLLEKRRLKQSDCLLATAAEEAANLSRFFPSTRIETIPLGIDPGISPDYELAREKLGWSPDECILLYLSRVHPKKGLKELMEALLSLPEGKVPKFTRLVIVGDGPKDYRSICEQLGETLQSKLSVDWIAPKWGDGKWPYLQGADLFCLPTYSENFGIVVLEAGIVGTPVFTTTGTPWKEIQDAGFGWVVDPQPGNYPAVLDQFFKMSVAGAGQKRAAFADWTRSKFGWPQLIRKYVTLYEDIAGTGGVRSSDD